MRFATRAIVENNVISGEFTKDAKSTLIARSLSGYDIPTGHIFSINNVLKDGAGSSGSINPTSVEPFEIPYNYSLVDTNLVEEHVLANAGADNASFDLTVCN